MQPRSNHVVIQPEVKETTAAGLYMPTVNTGRATGVVKAVGPEVESPLAEGQKVIYSHRNCVENEGCDIVPEEMIEVIL